MLAPPNENLGGASAPRFYRQRTPCSLAVALLLICETRDGSSAPNRSKLAGALPLLVRAASRAASAAFPVRRHLCQSISKPPARLKIRGRPSVRHPAVDVFVCRAGSPVAAGPVEWAALDAQCRCRRSSSENSFSTV